MSGAPRVGLFARADDPVSLHLAARLRALGAQVRVLDLSRIHSGTALSWDGEAWRLEGARFDDCDAYFVRKLPAETALLAPEQEQATAASWFARALLSRERAHLAQSALRDLAARGKRLVNPLSPFDLKPLQLAQLARAGVPVPRTRVSNDAAEVEAFRRACGQLVRKPVGGGAPARLFEAGQAVGPAAEIYQERLEGPDVRVTVVAGRVVSAVEVPTSALVDYRDDAGYRAGEQRYVPHALPPAAQALCVKAAEVCGQVLSGVDLKQVAPERYVVLEANASPAWLDVERKTGHRITDAVCDALLGR